MLYHEEKDFTSGSLSLDLEKEGMIEMSRFEGTIQMALGIRNFKYEFDIMNNPYIKV
jgi:hypothetical protein